MNRYLIFCRPLGGPDCTRPSPLHTLHRALTSTSPGHFDHDARRGLRAEICDWLVEQDILHGFTVEERTIPLPDALKGETVPWGFHFVLLEIQDDSDALNLRLRFDAKPLPEDFLLEDFPAPVWSITE